jgi:hypothetical protein
MHKPTYAHDISRILASMDKSGKDVPKDTKLLEEAEEPEAYDVYIEPDKITVIKRTEPQAPVIEAVQPPQTPPYVAYVTLTISLLLLCYLVTSAIITTFFPPTVTVTLFIKSQTIKTSGTLQLQARAIPPITLSESQTTPTTGKRHQDKRSAHGYITFFNGEFQSVTIPAGKAFTGSDGITVITDQDAVIPAANVDPPTFGQVTVSAHALNEGTSGNIAAYDINKPCCFASVLAKNPARFTGGQDERDFQTVTQQDIASLTATLKTNLSQSMQRALQAQIRQTEAIITLPCTTSITPDHRPGEEAIQVQVTVSETCKAIAYDKQSLEKQATAILTSKAEQQLGTVYSLTGDVSVTTTQPTTSNKTVTFVFTAQGVWVYALSQDVERSIIKNIAGKTQQDALKYLGTLPGIQRASINGGEEDQNLPKTISAIRIVIIA